MTHRLCIIGFGEAGAIFGAALTSHVPVRSYDILQGTPAFTKKAAQFTGSGIEFAVSAAEAAQGAQIVLSLVTAAASLDVAREAATYLKPGQIFLDFNSVSPGTKKASAAVIERSGAAYVDGAIMAPVPSRALAVPILLAGSHAASVVNGLCGYGMNLEVVADQVGIAAATKMCRSIIIKGIEALCSEAFLAARAHGVESRVLASLNDTFPGTDWNKYAGHQVGRSLVHGRRRAAEMREVATTVREAGLEPLMAMATALRQDWAADLSDGSPALKKRHDDEWLETLDLILAAGAGDHVRATGT
ncbi:NAD(P)-dependent oxidoreductase [Taklimakanibacter deserti]|uniref:NAD(P)-dependent oxidoreductase n=1 Tax=Taklimakanibacter deserti TaxID=2267839 RepID=UPI000E65BD84